MYLLALLTYLDISIKPQFDGLPPTVASGLTRLTDNHTARMQALGLQS